MFDHITQWIMGLMQTHGAATVFIGVIIESVIVPIPSPLIIMGAGAILIPSDLPALEVLVRILTQIVLPGSVASTVGSLIAFYVGYAGGKPGIERFSRFLGFNWEDVLRIEKLIAGRVALMLFALRALPVVPLSLISGAAGVLRMPLRTFLLWTFLGSLPRCLVLGYLGFLTKDSYNRLAGHLNSIESVVSLTIVIGAFALIFWIRSRLSRQR